MPPEFRFQGTGRNLQKDMLGDWFRALEGAPQAGEPVAYQMIGGNVAEVLRNFGYHLVFPEVNALQCGIKRAAPDLLLKAEDLGYSPDVCGYVKNDIGLAHSGNVSPMGKLPPPSLLVCTYSGCRTYIKWFEALAEYYQAPLFVLDVPYRRVPAPRAEDVVYVVAQLEELIEVCERQTGRKFDIDRLREDLARSCEAEDLWVRIMDAARHRPSPLDAYFEAVFFMAPINVLRGSEAGLRFYRETWREIQERLEFGLGPVPEERVRVVIEGPPPWMRFREFWDMFKAWGVVAVASTYAHVGGLYQAGVRHDPRRPLESLAEVCCNCYCNWNLGLRAELMHQWVRDFEADALVIHSVKSCRSFSVGQADTREHFIKDLNIPTLFVESDLVDGRYFSAAQIKNRVDAFFERLAHKKLVEAGV